MTLPNVDRAVVDPAKVRDYLLSPEHPVGRAKARFFKMLGFARAEWPELQHALRVRAATGQVEVASPARYGQKYAVRGILIGSAERSANVVSVWIVLKDEVVPRFVTAYAEDAL